MKGPLRYVSWIALTGVQLLVWVTAAAISSAPHSWVADAARDGTRSAKGVSGDEVRTYIAEARCHVPPEAFNVVYRSSWYRGFKREGSRYVEYELDHGDFDRFLSTQKDGLQPFKGPLRFEQFRYDASEGYYEKTERSSFWYYRILDTRKRRVIELVVQT